jgi:D-alanine-D-alanine ligase
VLDGAGLHYTGAHAYGSAFSSDKYAAKLYLLRLGVPVPKVWLASEPDGVEFPAILKSRFGHNSFGMDSSSVVRDAAALAGKVSDLGRHADQFVLEEFVDGEEVAAAFLGNDPRQALPQFQVVWGPAFEGRPRILDFDSKWSAESDVYHQSTPQRCTLPAEAQAAVDRALLLAASHLSMRDYGRCDFRVRRDDGAGWVPYLIDVNTNPDLSQDAGFFRMAKAAGLDYPRAIGRIVGAALQRPRRRGPLVGSGGLAGA